MRRLHTYKGCHVGIKLAGLKLQEAYQTYYKELEKAPAWRDEHNQSLIAPPKKSGELGKAALAARQRDNKNAVLMAVATKVESGDMELDSHAKVLPAMASSNLERQQEYISKPSMEPAFSPGFWILADTVAALEVINSTYVAPDSMYQSMNDCVDGKAKEVLKECTTGAKPTNLHVCLDLV